MNKLFFKIIRLILLIPIIVKLKQFSFYLLGKTVSKSLLTVALVTGCANSQNNLENEIRQTSKFNRYDLIKFNIDENPIGKTLRIYYSDFLRKDNKIFSVDYSVATRKEIENPTYSVNQIQTINYSSGKYVKFTFDQVGSQWYGYLISESNNNGVVGGEIIN